MIKTSQLAREKFDSYCKISFRAVAMTEWFRNFFFIECKQALCGTNESHEVELEPVKNLI